LNSFLRVLEATISAVDEDTSSPSAGQRIPFVLFFQHFPSEAAKPVHTQKKKKKKTMGKTPMELPRACNNGVEDPFHNGDIIARGYIAENLPDLTSFDNRLCLRRCTPEHHFRGHDQI